MRLGSSQGPGSGKLAEKGGGVVNRDFLKSAGCMARADPLVPAPLLTGSIPEVMKGTTSFCVVADVWRLQTLQDFYIVIVVAFSTMYVYVSLVQICLTMSVQK